MKDRITPSKALGYPDLYVDFVSEAESAGRFFLAPGLARVAHHLDGQAYDRHLLVDILTRQNRSYGASEATIASIERLRDPRTLCVFAGQQACLFGGPLLILYKAIGITKMARDLSARLERTVIPVFWIAGDDHDFEEVNHTWVLSRQAEPVMVSYSSAPAHELPTAEIAFADEAELRRAKDALADALGETDFTQDLYDLIERCYTSADTFVSAFARLMAVLTQKDGLVLFSPGDADVKRHAVGFFEAILDKHRRIHELLGRTNQEILQSGYHVQVEKHDEAVFMFCNQNGRKPILSQGDRLRVGDRTFGRNELLAQIHEHPETFSPDVITRPVFQSFLFPVLAQKAGPAEISYLAQINPIFALFDLVTPCHQVRPGATLVDKRAQQLMEQYDISCGELCGDIEQVVNRVLGESFPKDIEKKFADLRHDVAEHFNEYSIEALSFDPRLKEFARQTFGKIDFALKNFEAKVFSSHKKKSAQTRDRLYRLHHLVHPNRALQERSLNVSYFLSKYGFGILDFIREQLDPFDTTHQVIRVGEYDDR